jgi:hypothetical protein
MKRFAFSYKCGNWTNPIFVISGDEFTPSIVWLASCALQWLNFNEKIKLIYKMQQKGFAKKY